MAANKIIFGNETLIDLTSDTVQADKLASGYTAHDKSGAIITGTNTNDADTSDATATADEILSGKTAYVSGVKISGSMVNRNGVGGQIATKEGVYTIQAGYHDGSGEVSIAEAEQAKIIASNIREGVTILGVEGTMSGEEDVHAQTKSVTPYTTAQTVLPDADYNYLSQVNVAAISYTETDNAAGGKTITIGEVAPAAGE